MKLSKCTYGVLVQSDQEVGMVVGITTCYELADKRTRGLIENAIPLVKMSGEFTPRGIHHNNLTIFTK